MFVSPRRGESLDVTLLEASVLLVITRSGSLNNMISEMGGVELQTHFAWTVHFGSLLPFIWLRRYSSSAWMSATIAVWIPKYRLYLIQVCHCLFAGTRE